MRSVIFAVAAATAFSTQAQAGPVLWRNIDAGMAREQVQLLYPAVKGEVHHKANVTVIENVQQVTRCHPDVHVNYRSGLVATVTVQSRFRGFPKETCAEDASRSLLAKYGQVSAEDRSEQQVGGLISKGIFKGLDTSRAARDTKQQWLRGGVLVTFERFDPDGDDTWQITYEVPADMGL